MIEYTILYAAIDCSVQSSCATDLGQEQDSGEALASAPPPEAVGENNSSAEGDAHRLRNGLDLDAGAGRDAAGDRPRGAGSAWRARPRRARARGLAGRWPLGSRSLPASATWPSSGWSLQPPVRAMCRRLAWAEMAFGAVVPVGGAGGLAVGAWAMRAWGFSWSRIVNRSAVIFLLTSAVNGAVTGPRRSRRVGRPRHASRRSPVWPGTSRGDGVALGTPSSSPPLLARRVGPEPGPIGSLVVRLASWVRDTEAAAAIRAQLAGARLDRLPALRHRRVCGRACGPSDDAAAAGDDRRLSGRLPREPRAGPRRNRSAGGRPARRAAAVRAAGGARRRRRRSCTTRSRCGCPRSAGRPASCACERRCRRRVARSRP